MKLREKLSCYHLRVYAPRLQSSFVSQHCWYRAVDSQVRRHLDVQRQSRDFTAAAAQADAQRAREALQAEHARRVQVRLEVTNASMNRCLDG